MKTMRMMSLVPPSSSLLHVSPMQVTSRLWPSPACRPAPALQGCRQADTQVGKSLVTSAQDPKEPCVGVVLFTCYRRTSHAFATSGCLHAMFAQLHFFISFHF